MRRLGFLLIAAIALMAMVAVACGGGEEASPTPTKSPGATATSQASPTSQATAAPTSSTQASDDLTALLGKASALDSVSYDMVMTAPDTTQTTSKVWLKAQAQKMKTETTMEGQTAILIIDWNANVMYNYMPDQNLAFKMDLSSAPESPVESTESIEDYHPVVLGTETYDGKECLVVQYTAAGAQIKEWIWKQYGFPVKIVTTTSEGTTTVEYKNISFSSISDSVFELPPGVQIMQM